MYVTETVFPARETFYKDFVSVIVIFNLAYAVWSIELNIVHEKASGKRSASSSISSDFAFVFSGKPIALLARPISGVVENWR